MKQRFIFLAPNERESRWEDQNKFWQARDCPFYIQQTPPASTSKILSVWDPNCYQDWLHVFVCLRFQSLAANNYIHTRTLLSQKVIFTLSLNDSFSFSTAMTSTSARRSCPASRSTGRTGDIKVGLVWAGQWAGQGGVSGDTLSEARLAPASSLSSLSVLRDRDYFVQIPWVKVVPGYWVG